MSSWTRSSKYLPSYFRDTTLALVQAVADNPEQRVVDESHPGRWIRQSQLRFEGGKMYLLRVVVDEEEQPPVIIHGLPHQQD